jgi:hypothetical protein
VQTVLSILTTAVLYRMALCVYAKQPMQEPVEAVHNLSILYVIYDIFV